MKFYLIPSQLYYKRAETTPHTLTLHLIEVNDPINQATGCQDFNLFENVTNYRDVVCFIASLLN